MDVSCLFKILILLYGLQSYFEPRIMKQTIPYDVFNRLSINKPINKLM